MTQQTTTLSILFLAVAAMAIGAEVQPVPTEITAEDMNMKTVGSETRAIFEGSVAVTGTNLKILADKLEIVIESVGEKNVTLPKAERFKYLLATGHVRISQADRQATAGRAEVFPREEKVILTLEPIVIDRSGDGKDLVFSGERIEWKRGDAALTVTRPKFLGPEIKDLGLSTDKAAQGSQKAPEKK